MTANKSFSIIWLDVNATDPHSSFRSKIGQILNVFTNTQDCLDFIQTDSSQAIYLITSGSLGTEIVPKIYDLPQLVKIYLFCGSISTYLIWSLDYLDKVIIFEHGDDVLQRLWTDLAKYFRGGGDVYHSQVKEFEERAARYRKVCG